MGLVRWFRSLSRSAATPPDPVAEVRRPEWPALPPLQRVIPAPSLVTDPDRFQRQLAAWGNPSFLGTPGHLLAPDAPSGQVSGVAVPDGRGSFDTHAGPPARDPWTAAPVLSSASAVPTAQRSSADAGQSPPLLRTAPHAGPAPGASIDLVSAASADLPPPITRPSGPLPPQAPPPLDRGPEVATEAWQPVATPAVDVQRQPARETSAPAGAFPGPAVQRSVPAPIPQEPQVPPAGTETSGAEDSAVLEPTELSSSEAVGPAASAPDAARTGLADEPATPADTFGSAPYAGITDVGLPYAGITDAGLPMSGSFRGAADPSPARVQRLSPDVGVVATSGRRRLGLGAPLPSVPSPVADPVPSPAHEPAPPVQTPPPSVDTTPSVVQRLRAPAGRPSAVRTGMGVDAGVQRRTVDTLGSRGSSAPPAGAPVFESPVPSAPTRQPPIMDAATSTGSAPTEPEPAATEITATDTTVTEVPLTETAATGTTAAGTPATETTATGTTAMEAAARGTATTETATTAAPADGPTPVPDAGIPPLEAPTPDLATAAVPTLGVSRLAVPSDAPTPPVQRSAGHGATSRAPAPTVARGHVPSIAADGAPALQRADMPAVDGRAAGSGVGLSVPSVPAEPQFGASTASGRAAPLLGAVAPLPAGQGAGERVLQRERDVESAPASGLPLQRAVHPGETASAAQPSRPAPAAVQRAQPLVGQPSAIPGRLPVAASVDPLPQVSAGAAEAPLDRDPGGATPDREIPASGSVVGPVGSRPLQRRLAEAAVPGTPDPQPSASAWVPGVPASGPVQRYPTSAGVPAPAGPRYPDGRLTVSRTATAPGVPSSRFGPPLSSARPPSGRAESRPEWSGPAVSPTLQTLVAADDARPQPGVPATSDLVVERAESSADGADRGPFEALAPLTVSAVVEPPPAAPGAAAAGGPGAAASVAPGDVDALVRRLYDPLARRLRAELRLDRERIGRSLDLRH